MITVGGFCVTASSIGGQCLAQVSGGKISTEVGIVIIMIPASFLAFSGYKILHIYQRWGWIPTFVVLCITFGYGGRGLKNQATPPPPEAPTVINIIALIAGYLISWGNVVGDYCVYMPANAPKWRLFTYCLMGISLPLAALLTAGAAIGGAIINNPTWLAAYKLHSTGGVLGAMLEDAGGFGKFILVVVAFSVLGSCGRDMYTISVDWQILVPKANKIPRLVWVIVTAGCVVGVAIGAVRSFYTALENFLYFIAYWSSSYVAVIMLEFMWFRKNRPESYDHEIWDTPSRLPPGIAATVASLVPWALVVPSMAETWYTGPIAKVTGDLGFEFAGVITALLYIPFRMFEIRWRKGIN